MITAILLAAGTSSRLGQPKQLLSFRGRPLIRHMAETLLAAQIDDLIVVLGHQATRIAQALEGLPLRIVVNANYRLGLSSSLKTGLAAQNNSTGGILFTLGDLPLLQPTTINLLIQEFYQQGGIVVPYYQGTRGNPVLFDQSYVHELSTLSGDVGARELFNRHRSALREVEVADPGVILDIDTQEDLCRLL